MSTKKKSEVLSRVFAHEEDEELLDALDATEHVSNTLRDCGCDVYETLEDLRERWQELLESNDIEVGECAVFRITVERIATVSAEPAKIVIKRTNE